MPGLHRGQGAYGEFTRGSQCVAREVFAFSCALACGRLVARTPLFARSGFTNDLGKLDDDPIKAFKVPIGVKAALQQQASEMQPPMPFHEYLREVLTVVAFGPEAVKSARVGRVDAIAKKLKER